MRSEVADREQRAIEAEQSGVTHGLLQTALHLLALTGLVIAQPIFSAYQNNPELFVARSSTPFELVMLSLVVAIVPPAVLIGIAALAGWRRPSWRRYAASTFVGAFVALFVLQGAARVPAIPLLVSLGLAILAGLAASRIYQRRVRAGQFLRLLSPAPVIFLGLFLLTPPISALVLPQDESSMGGPTLASDAPVVFILFDEMPEVSLLNANQEIDRLRYPNIARLADDATWFRNAAAAHPYTTRSIPSLLSGELPDPDRLARASDFPTSLFTLFGSTHTLSVNEPVTDICPESLCPSELRSDGSGSEVTELARITYDVYQRIVIPELFNDVVLTLDDPFGRGDRLGAEVASDQRQRFRDFIAQIDGTDGRLYYDHFFLPHVPFHYLPSGRAYNRESQSEPGINDDSIWFGDPWHTVDNHQRHMLQMGAVDKLIGELIDHLIAIDAYDKTMIVITSDHGVAHIPEQPRRDITESTLYDIGLVPLIIKAPHQATGVVDDRLVQAVDVLPTIADMLGADGPWPGDGISLVDGEGRASLLMRDQQENDVRIDIEGDGRLNAIRLGIDRFGESGGEHDLFAFGPFADLVGMPSASLSPASHILEATVDDPLLYQGVDPDSGFVPAYVSGQVEGLSRLPVEPHLALVLNGVIGAVVPLHDVEGDTAGFGGVVNDSLFEDGANALSILSIHEIDGEIVANEIATNIPPVFSSAVEGGSEVLESSAGDRYGVRPDGVLGFVDTATRLDGAVVLSGWAIDDETLDPVEAVVVFIGDRYVATVTPTFERPGLVDDFDTERVLRSGFIVTFPESALSEGSSDLRVYGVSRDGATVLTIIESALESLESGG